MFNTSRLLRNGLLALLAGGAAALHAAYPDRPIKIIVGFPAGGTTDVVARLVGASLSASLKQPVVVENRPGMNGVAGTQVLAKSAPDGYTLAVVSSGHAINGSLHSLSYDAQKSFAPIILAGSVPLMAVVHPSSPANSFAQFLEMARAKGGTVTFKSGGVGGSDHLATELLMRTADIKMVNVPYKGDPPAANDLMGNQIDFGLFNVTSVIQLVKAGKLKALAVSSERRIPQLPSLPTVDEAGLKGYTAGSWHAFLAPAGTPAEIVQLLNAQINRILQSPEVSSKLVELGMNVEGGSPEKLGDFLGQEIGKWARIIREAGIKAELN